MLQKVVIASAALLNKKNYFEENIYVMVTMWLENAYLKFYKLSRFSVTVKERQLLQDKKV